MNRIYIFAIYATILNCLAVFSSKLNVPRVLLPIFNEFEAKFTIEATEGGCYKWTTTRSDVISLEPLDIDIRSGCSPRVNVHSITKEWARNIAVVLAEDVETHTMLRCDVIVDVIDNISVVTTTKELFMEEAPEAFEVRAYDRQGNEFTTLEGVEFSWQLECLGSSRDVAVIRYITFKDSPYETPPTVAELEDCGKKGHIVLLEGVKTGSAKVTVQFVAEEYHHVQPVDVFLTVLANLIISPSNIYVMIGDTIRFKIMQLHRGVFEKIELPHVEYYLSSDDESIAYPDARTGTVTAISAGMTKIMLRNRNMDDNEDVSIKLPSAIMNVVSPSYMSITILPHRNWAILLSEHHDMAVEVYSSENQRLYLGESVQIHTQVGEIFHVQERSRNGSWLTGWAKREGIAKVSAVLDTIVSSKLGSIKIKPELKAQAEFTIFPPIVVTPSEVILPWDSKKKPRYQVQVIASGGDGKFLWSSSNHSVGSVSQAGFVKTHAAGSFEVAASMMRNHHNRETARFHILQPTRLEIVEYAMEAEVGQLIFLHIALYTEIPKENGPSVQIPFTSCENLPFKVKPSNLNFYHNKSAVISPVGISCGNVAVVGVQIGVSKITVIYHSEGKKLEDSVTVSTFQPLKLVYPQNCLVVLAVGSSTNLLFIGGPKPVIGRPTAHKRSVTSEDSTTVAASDVTSQLVRPESKYVAVNVLCLQLGDSDVVVTVSNIPEEPHCTNQEGTVTMRVICGKPRNIILKPELTTRTGNCPMDLSSQRVVVQSNKDVRLTVAVLDENDYVFLNISTLKFEWSVHPPDLGVLGNYDSTFEQNIEEEGVIIANHSYQIITPVDDSGIIEVTAKIVGYDMKKLSSLKIIPEYPEFMSEDDFDREIRPPIGEVQLYLVKDARVTPSALSIYNHPRNRKRIAVNQGSGYFDLLLSNTDVAKVSYLETSHEIEIIPVKDGDLRIGLTDQCLASKTCSINIEIVSVRTIRVEMADKVEIGKCISCIVRLYDASDNLVAIPDLKLLELNLDLDKDIAKFKLATEDDKSWNEGEIHYIVTGVELGDTVVVFSVSDVRSGPINLQVFPPLKMYPRNATILIGSVLQLSSKGGPQPDSTLEYHVDDTNIGNVSSNGLLYGLALGHCKVSIRAVGVNPTTGSRVRYSNDTIDVNVIAITGIKIAMPLTRFRVGAKVPVWCSGIPEQLSPTILGAVDPPMRFEWEVQDREVMRLHTPLERYGIEYAPEDNVAIRIIGLSPGRSLLYLTATTSGAAANHPDRPSFVFTSSLEIEVFEHFLLTSPLRLPDSAILMAPHSVQQLRTNLDSDRVQYKLLASTRLTTDNTESDRSSLSNPVVTLSETGLLQSRDMLGRVMIVVSARDEFGLKQTLSYIVEVKPIYYMLLHVRSDWQLGKPITVLPLGTNFTLKVSYHDNTGAAFTVGSTTVGLRSSRFDLTRFRLGNDNTTVVVSVVKPGISVIKVWAEDNERTADYFKLRIEQLITPVMDHLVTGDIVCMSSPLEAATKTPVKWSTSERNVLSLDDESGVGQVTSLKGGQIVIAHTLHPSASLNIKVVPPSLIVLMPESDMILTNSANATMYRIPLLLTTHYTDRDKNLLAGWPCEKELEEFIMSFPFICRMEFINNLITILPNELFTLSSGFDPSTGRYTCDIVSEKVHSPAISILHSNITIWAELITREVESDPYEIYFVPSVYAEPDLFLDDKLQGDLVIYGIEDALDNTEVVSADSYLIQVGKGTRPKPSMLIHHVTLSDYHWKLGELADPLSVTILSKLTNETLKVYVRVPASTRDRYQKCPAGQQSPLFTLISEYRHPLLIIGSMMVIFLITFYAYCSYFQPVVQVNVSSDRSLLSSSQSRLSSPKPSPTYSAADSGGSRYMHQMPCTPSRCPNYTTGREPVFGDPNSFYCTSPEMRRNRRYM